MATMSKSIRPTSPTMTVEEAAAYIGISRSAAYSEASRYRATGGSEGLPNIRFAGRILVNRQKLVELVEPLDASVRRDAASRTRRATLAVRRRPISR